MSRKKEVKVHEQQVHRTDILSQKFYPTGKQIHIIFFFQCKSMLTPAINFDSKKFKGHLLNSLSSTGGGGGLQTMK